MTATEMKRVGFYYSIDNILSMISGASYTLPAATASVIGGVKRGVAVVNATDEPSAVTQLNALLASLRTAGVIAP